MNASAKSDRLLEGAGCDTSLFEDTDGKAYAIMPFGDIFIQEVNLRKMDLLGERAKILNSGNGDIGKSSPEYLEGPWMIKRNGKYILFTAAPYKNGGPNADLKAGYWTGTASSDNICGPYTKEPQIFPGGHITIFEGLEGTPWISYRGESGGEGAGRLNLQPVPFEKNGLVKAFEPSE